MSPFRDPAPPSAPRSFDEVSDEVLCKKFTTNRHFFLDFKDAFAFEDAKREAEWSIRSVDPDAIVILTATPSEVMQEKLDRLARLRTQMGGNVDGYFGQAEKIQTEWEAFRKNLTPEELAELDNMSEPEQIRRMVRARRVVRGTYLRWLTNF